MGKTNDRLLSLFRVITHIPDFLKFEDPMQRAFCEIECIGGSGNWSVRELKRQIGSLYCERFGLSGNKKTLSEVVR
jgi:predicted nuclease of restriction endonuclease-like (RecB) superfamily